MAGLIWAGIGKGIADAGSTMANIGIREYERRDAARLRSGEREEARADRAELEQDRREWQAGQNEIYRRTAAQQTAGSKGTGGDGISGFDPKDLEPGGKLSPYMAAEAGMSTEDYEKQVTAMKTKDMSGYATETRDAGRVLDDEYGEQTVTEKVVPEAFKKEFAAKAKVISGLMMNYAAGKEAKTIAEGRQTGLITNTMEGVLAGTITPTKGGQATAVGKGTAPFGGDSNVTRNVLTGDTSTTAVGTATVGEKGALAAQATAGAAENTAQAKAADALAAERRAALPKLAEEVKKLKAETEKIIKEIGQVGVDKPTHERLSSIINSANATVTALQNTSKGNTAESKKAWDTQLAEAEALRQKAIALQTGALDSRNTPPPAAAAATSGTRPVANDGIPTVSFEEAKKLKSGTRFRVSGSNEIRTKN